jgi:serine/threonine-protein kinase PknK
MTGPAGYQIVQTIGHGASSTVHEAVQVSTGRRVALKVVGTSTPGGDAERLYTRERSILARLGEHPHIVSIVDAGEWDGRFWLAMEHCPYGSVARPGERLAVTDAVAVASGVGTALDAAHRAGLVHCDVKPANILRNAHGDPALADFGIARFVLATGHGSTATGYTLDHASPEVLDGERPTGASDVWSLGTSLWELLEGRPPFRRAEEVAQSAVIRRICFEDTPPLSRDDVPDELRTLIAEMTRKTPADRPSIVDVIARARALQDVVGTPDPDRWSRTIVAPAVLDTPARPVPPVAPGPGGRPGTTGGLSPDQLTHLGRHPHQQWTPPVLDAPAPPRPRRRPWLVLAAAVIAVLLVGSGGVVTWRLANAESAPAPATVAPAPPTTTTAAPSSTTTPEPVPAVVVPEEPTTRTPSSAGGGTERPVTTSDDPPAQEKQAPQTQAGIGDIEITGASCQFHGGNSCSSTTSAVSFDVAVTDTTGKSVESGCQVTPRLTKQGKQTSSFTSRSCGSHVSFTANGSGDYVIELDVTWNGSSRSKTFGLTVE